MTGVEGAAGVTGVIAVAGVAAGFFGAGPFLAGVFPVVVLDWVEAAAGAGFDAACLVSAVGAGVGFAGVESMSESRGAKNRNGV